MSTALNITIFAISLSKNIFDIIINPLVFKYQKTQIPTTIEAVRKKRTRGDIGTTLVFIAVTIISGITLMESSMNESVTTEAHQALETRVNDIEKYLFPNGGSPNGVSIDNIVNRIESLESKVSRKTTIFATKEELDEVIEVLAKLKPILKQISARPKTNRAMTAEM